MVEAGRLLELKQVAVWATKWGIEAIRIEPRREGQGPFVVLECGDSERLRPLVVDSRRTIRVVDPRQACVVLEQDETDGVELLELVKEVLQPA
mgnify:CR=1 FL=1